ncbi:MAG: hypothetical protein GC158_04645 [Cyanobacteria bacterium RI_101]|nr:hypothetical protein [Cyanobacteria bacterium RI_101]
MLGLSGTPIDLGAESTIAAQRDQEKIAVEIKSFITDLEISEFHTALGQYLNYVQALEEEEPDRALHRLSGDRARNCSLLYNSDLAVTQKCLSSKGSG